MIFRPATLKDVEFFYPEGIPTSVKAIIAEHNGAVLAIGGLYKAGQQMVCFSGMVDDMRRFPKQILKMARLVMKMCQLYPCVYAVASENEATSKRFISHFGFEPFWFSTDGEIYVWHRR